VDMAGSVEAVLAASAAGAEEDSEAGEHRGAGRKITIFDRIYRMDTMRDDFKVNPADPVILS